MLGACVGDAAGAALEFLGRLPTTNEVEAALSMVGGGAHRVGPGQVTDDGELTLALWTALYRHKPKLGPPIDEMMRAYVRWMDSMPFDCGTTCGNAFAIHADLLKSSTPSIDEALQQIKAVNGASQANGALMRATAIVHWAAGVADVPASMVALMARVDAQLSHPNQVCQDCSALYVYACTLLERRKTPAETWRLLSAHAIETVSNADVLRWLFNDSQKDLKELRANGQDQGLAASFVANAAEQREQHYPRTQGHVRWAFTAAMHFLQRPEIGFKEAIRQTLALGGDTDTNAAIVGGLVATYQPIPESMRKAVMTFRATGPDGRKRPEWLWPWTYFS